MEGCGPETEGRGMRLFSGCLGCEVVARSESVRWVFRSGNLGGVRFLALVGLGRAGLCSSGLCLSSGSWLTGVRN